MIDKTNKSKSSDEIVESRKNYYAIMIGTSLKGISTRIETAEACAKYYAKKYNAVKAGGDDALYYCKSSDGSIHPIYIKATKRVRMSNMPDE